LTKNLIVGTAVADSVAQVIEISDHRCRREQNQFPAGNMTDPESMGDACWNEDERPRRARELLAIKEGDVLTLEDIERFGGVAMNVERWPEVWRLSGL
jgi:hypothetical protein